jgi:hypothetical protein
MTDDFIVDLKYYIRTEHKNPHDAWCDPDDVQAALDEIERLRAALEKIAQHDMQAIALNALRLNPVRTRPAKKASDDAAT